MVASKKEIVFNLIFWLLYFLYQWFGLAALSGEYELYFYNAAVALPSSFIAAYVTVHILIKNYYKKGKKWNFWILQLSFCIALLLMRRVINFYFLYPRIAPEAQQVPFFSFGKLIVEWVNLYLITGFYALFYFVRSWYDERQRVQSLEQDKTLAELELLKSQVQPHFIFNALNNIYATALPKSPETSRLISHLSSLLNYSLYEAKEPFVPLSAEIAYLEHFIEIQKNRYGTKLDASLNVYDAIDGLFIAPLLLLPLVENSFKHGIANAVRGGWIRIDVSRQQETFSIKIENSVEEKGPAVEQKNGGIGLSNVQRRLGLIYPDTHEFKIVKEAHTYLAVLKIKT